MAGNIMDKYKERRAAKEFIIEAAKQSHSRQKQPTKQTTLNKQQQQLPFEKPQVLKQKRAVPDRSPYKLRSKSNASLSSLKKTPYKLRSHGIL